LRHEFKKDADLQNQQFFYKKTYDSGSAKPVTQSTFNEKLKHFDLGQTIIEQEIVGEYSYTDQTGKPDSVQIVVRERNLRLTATIDFKDAVQHERFACPAWLTAFGAADKDNILTDTHGV
jgi:hypothetical protein